MCKKPLIIICGMNYSGTSSLVKVLKDHGAVTGKEDSGGDYPQYENEAFKRLAIDMLKRHNYTESLEALDAEIDKADNDRVMVLKYPRAAHVLPDLLSFLMAKRTVKIVYPVRNVVDVIRSHGKREGTNIRHILGEWLHAYRNITDIECPVYLQAVERLDKDCSGLLEFCEVTL